MRFSILIFIYFFLSQDVKAQSHGSFDFEFAINRSLVSNQEMLEHNGYSISLGARVDSIFDERSTWFTNYNFSFGIQILKGHRLRLKYSQSTVGATLDGYYLSSDDNFSFYDFYYENRVNRVPIRTVGVLYEYTFDLDEDALFCRIGLDYQHSEYYDVIVFFDGLGQSNFARYLSIGYKKKIVNEVYLLGSCYQIKSYDSNELRLGFEVGNTYLPISWGIEIGLKYEFGRQKN